MPDIRAQRGGTMLGLIAGLLFGLVIAVVVAVYVKNAPVPFVNKGPRTPPPAAPVDPANAPDPNRSLYGRDAPAGAPPATGPSATEPAPAPVPEARRDPLGDMIANNPALSGQPAPGAAQPSAPQPATPSDGSVYYLQVGAYRVIEDAESLKARLAFMGFEARLEAADLKNGTVHRVRIGPFAKLDDMNRTRARLAENGIEAAVVKK